jgi:very-short-patch-repair endonuclease
MPVEAKTMASPLVGEVGGGRDASASQMTLSAADAAAPPPNPPHKGEGLRRLGLPAGATARARRLRRSMTPAERALWWALREALPGQHWRKQVPFGPYVADFCSHEARLIIEVDGGQHATDHRDALRTRFLEAEGYRVLRFWNNDVLGNPDGVVQRIAEMLPAHGRIAS